MAIHPAEEEKARVLIASREAAGEKLTGDELALHLGWCRTSSSEKFRSRMRSRAIRLMDRIAKVRPLVKCPIWVFSGAKDPHFRAHDTNYVRLDPRLFPVRPGRKYEIVQMNYRDELSFGINKKTRYLIEIVEEPETVAGCWCFVTIKEVPRVRYIRKAQLDREEFEEDYPDDLDVFDKWAQEKIPTVTVQAATVGKKEHDLLGAEITKAITWHGYVKAILWPHVSSSFRDFNSRPSA